MQTTQIDRAVQQVVLAWGEAKDLQSAAQTLSQGRRGLSPQLKAQLVSEIAELSAQLLLLTLTPAPNQPEVAPEELVHWMDVSLHPEQAKQLAAWTQDQQSTAKALGLSVEAWMNQLESGLERYLKSAPQEPGAQGDSHKRSVAQTRAFLGKVKQRFENRPGSSQSAQAGLTGLLALRNFPK